jgi:uncharacterized protein YjbJ (UPF0337 family)
MVCAPSLIPRKPGERVKTDRRDAIKLVRSLRAGDLWAVYVAATEDEAFRDLPRARATAREDLRQARQPLKSFLLAHGTLYRQRKLGQFTPLTSPARGRRSRGAAATEHPGTPFALLHMPARYGRQTIHESVLHWRSAMNKDQVKGTAEKVKGKVNETIGRATGDRKQEVKGDVQQAVGEARKKAGDVKEAVKDTTTQKP